MYVIFFLLQFKNSIYVERKKMIKNWSKSESVKTKRGQYFTKKKLTHFAFINTKKNQVHCKYCDNGFF